VEQRLEDIHMTAPWRLGLATPRTGLEHPGFYADLGLWFRDDPGGSSTRMLLIGNHDREQRGLETIDENLGLGELRW
jgi:hypothetical protein